MALSPPLPGPSQHGHVRLPPFPQEADILLRSALYRLPKSNYYDKHYRQSAALIRARQPYLIKNIVPGISIFSFAIGVCKLPDFILQSSA